MSQDNRLLSLTSVEGQLERPLRDLNASSVSLPAPGPNSPFFDQAQLRHYLRIVLKRKWLILALAVIVTSLVTIQMYRLPDVFEAKTMIQIEPKKSVLQTQQLMINSSNYDPNYWTTQLALLSNPQLARQVVLALDLQNNPAFLSGQATPSVLTSVKKVFSGGKAKQTTQSNLPVVTDSDVDVDNLTPEQLDALEPYESVISANLIVAPQKDTNLVDLHFRHNDPEVAAKVANTLAEAFIANDVRRETKGSDRASDILARNIIELQMKIKQGEEARINYLKNHNLPLGTGAGQNLTGERLAMVSGQLLTAENERKNAHAVYQGALKEDDVWSIPEVQGDARVAALRGRIADLEEKKAAMLVTYTQEWPEVKKLDEQIKRIKQDLDKAPQEILRSLKTRYEVALTKEARLKEGYGAEKSEANEQNVAAIDLSRITTELETNKQYYNTLFQRQKELLITSLDRANNVTVATPARTPRAPVGPQRMRNIIVALLLSVGIGIGLAFLLDFLDDSLKSSEDVESHIHLPTLALIPAPRLERASLLKGNKAAEPAEPTRALALISDARSSISEAYRHLRTSLLLSSAGQPPKSILFTSSQPSEGKTTTAVNTAVMLAQTGASVLLVDCDLRRPRLHFQFNLPNKRGVSNFLSGDTDLDSMFQPYEAQPNLKVLVSGPVPPNPAELLGSDEMRRLMLQLGERFTHVVIDSPPAISFTDASILSTMVDGVVLVAHGGRSSRAVVRRAKQRLLDVGANIYGVVLNNVKADASDYYGGYYADYYAEGEEEQQLESPPNAGAIGRGAS